MKICQIYSAFQLQIEIEMEFFVFVLFHHFLCVAIDKVQLNELQSRSASSAKFKFPNFCLHLDKFFFCFLI